MVHVIASVCSDDFSRLESLRACLPAITHRQAERSNISKLHLQTRSTWACEKLTRVRTWYEHKNSITS
ncbi:MAG: hypothetical protein U0586_03990 [Candidatus Brocadiaceae bacterium]